MTGRNDREFLLAVLERLDTAGVPAWVFGGWAEELCGLIEPRPHRDIDLLYPAEDFHAVDAFLAVSPDLLEVRAKRFSHKRAFLVQDVLVELVLVRQKEGCFYTRFFDGSCTLTWPGDVFGWNSPPDQCALRSASPAALRFYRAHHAEVERAYRAASQK